MIDKIRSGLLFEKPRLPYYYYWGGLANGLRNVELLHFWNTIVIPPSRMPYITTFEATVPRNLPVGRLMDLGLTSLSSSYCKRLIAISKRCKLLQLDFNKANGLGEVDAKIEVLLPPQDVLVDEYALDCRESVFKKDGVLRLIFIGYDFYRKGGAALLKAAVRLRRDFPLELFVIGDFRHWTYTCSKSIDCAEEIDEIIAHNEWIHHFRRMPNNLALDLAKHCHVGFLPTRDDTFGYSVLEFQACGLPCITTDVCSLTEVNNERIGWLIDIPGDAYHRADFSSPSKIQELSNIIETGLEMKLRCALSNPAQIFEKGRLSLENIRRNHSPSVFGQKLIKIYDEALG